MSNGILGVSTRRTGILTLRNIKSQIPRSPGYELEDLIAEELEPGAILIHAQQEQSGMSGKLGRWLRRYDLASPRPSGMPLPVEQDLDLFFFAPALPHDLLALDAFSDWRTRSRKAVCFLQEIWIAEMDWQMPNIRHVLEQFDHVICAFYFSAEKLSELIDTSVSFMPHCVNAELFNPFNGRHVKPRAIDVSAVGNVDPDAHAALWDWAERTGRYYNFSTTSKAVFASNHKIHRHHLTQTLQRSKYFFTFMAKRVITDQRATQEEFGPRYFEGAAAGAIQLGDIVRSNPGFMGSVDWEDAVIEVDYRSTKVPALLEELERDPVRIEAARRRNVVQCLRRHDYLYRWDEVLKSVDLPPTGAMQARRARLREQAVTLSDEPALEAS